MWGWYDIRFVSFVVGYCGRLELLALPESGLWFVGRAVLG